MRLEGVYETENSIYVILEYLEGSQLNDLLKVRIDSSRVAVSSIASSIEQYFRIS